LIAKGFLEDFQEALETHPRRLSPKYFYDAAGSALFDRICELPEYYPTRTELRLLSAHAGEIATLAGENAEIVEFGAGSLHKIRLLLDALVRPRRYIPIDISASHLKAAAETLQRDYADLDIVPIIADYTEAFALPGQHKDGVAGRRLGFFPGSTLGNLAPEAALGFLARAREMLRGGCMLLGVDLIKDPAVLHAAYNDSAGVTAAFNLNLLERANRELGTDFDPSGFLHGAFYNSPLRRVEMHLMSRRHQTVRLAGKTYAFEEGETLHTENSYKFTVTGLQDLAERAGFRPQRVWTDSERFFSLHWLEARP